MAISPPGSITRTFPAAFAAAVALVVMPPDPVGFWREAPEFIELFAPMAHRGAYQGSVTNAGLDAVLTGLADDPSLVRVPGAWTARPEPPLDAFGRSGAYDRWKVARLYRSRQPSVARGARMEAGRVTESWTLVSPYPSGDLTRLEPGTLRIVLRIAP